MTGLVFFGTVHILTILLIAGVIAGAVYFSRRYVARRNLANFAFYTALVFAVFRIADYIIREFVVQQSIKEWFPLYLCSVAHWLVVFMLIRRSERLFDMAFFLGLAGGATGIITPAYAFPFPHPLFFFYFIGHAFLVFGVLFMMVNYRFRPRPRTLLYTLLVVLGLWLAAIPVNLLFGTNFLFQRQPPPGATIVDHMGPWPWYQLWLALASVVVCLAVYSPWFVYDLMKKTITPGIDK